MSGSRRKSSSSRPKDILLNSLNNLSIREDGGPHQFRREDGGPHQFRHLVAKLYLDRHPDAFETVQRLLGHKSRETTMRFYRELDAILAGKRSPRLYYPPASLPSPANPSLHQDHAKPPLGASPGGTIGGAEAVQVQIPATASSLPGYRASQCRGMVRAHRAGRRSGTAGHPGREPTERLGDADRAWLPHTRWRRSSIKGSEFSSILKRSGPEELIATLERQTEQLAMK